MYIVYLFILFFIYSSLVSEYKNKFIINSSLIILCVILAIGAGLRDEQLWGDTLKYIDAYRFDIPTWHDFNFSIELDAYSEKGFILLSSIIKTFTSNEVIYFLVISFLTFIFLIIDFRKFSVFPLIGICVYISRFYIGRNLIQIRAGLAIAIAMTCIYYAHKRQLLKFLLVIIIGSFFHKTMLILIPFYWINKLDIKKIHVVACLVVSFLVAAFLTPYIRMYITDMAVEMNYTNYVDSYKAYGVGLSNPMIYYQSILLLLFTFYQNKLQDKIDYYTEIRNAYLYSTVFLIVLSQWAIASGRLSTIFATFEISIIPSFLYLFNHHFRWAAYIVIGICMSLIFYLNYSSHVFNTI